MKTKILNEYITLVSIIFILLTMILLEGFIFYILAFFIFIINLFLTLGDVICNY